MQGLGLTGFALFGAALVLIGSHQAELARDLALDLERSGLLGAALSFGIAVGLVGAGPLVDRFRRRPIFVAAVGLGAAALLGTDDGMRFPRALAHLTLLGLGMGAYQTLLNAALAERHGPRTPRMLSRAHAAATAGAVVAPVLFGWLAARGGWGLSFHVLGGGFAGLALWGAALRFPPPGSEDPKPGASGKCSGDVSQSQASVPLRDTPAGEDTAAAHPSGMPAQGDPRPARPRGATSAGGQPSRLRRLAPLACIGFAYVGAETALTLFAVPYATGALGLDAARGRTAISAFWLGLLAGRVLAGAWRGRIDARALRAAGVLSGLVILIGVRLSASLLELVVGITGLALGLVFPVMIALAVERVPRARGTAAGLVAGAGAAGGFTVPWVTGAVGDALGVAAAVASLSFWCVAIAAAAHVAWRSEPARVPGPE